MAAGANSLTERVTRPETNAGRRWSMPANDLRVMMNGMASLGYETDPLLSSAGLHAPDLADPDLRISCEAVGNIFARACEVRFTPNLALELARLTPIGSNPLLDYLVLTSDTVGAGMRQLVHYFELVGNPVVLNLREDSDPIRIEMVMTPSPFAVEFSASLIVLHLRTETDGRFAAERIRFQHQPDDAVAFERILGCPIESMAASNDISVPLEAWRLPLRRRDPVLRQVLETQANEILARLPARTGIALEVQRALTKRVSGGDTRIDAVARQLAISGRTLQRRLAVEGVSYQELLEDARKEAAGRYISESSMAIGEVAYLVGYSEPAPFHRAFKRWYGTTPDVFRRRHREERH